MTKAQEKFIEYFNSNKISKLVLTKDVVICLPNNKLAKQIAKEQRKALCGIIEKIKYSPMILNGDAIERTDFYCGGNYDNRYSSVAEIKYLTVIDNPDIEDKDQRTSIFVCATSPEQLKSSAGIILDIIDVIGAQTHFIDKNGYRDSAGEIEADIVIGNTRSKTIKMEGRSVGLSHSKSALDAVVDTIVEHNNLESEM